MKRKNATRSALFSSVIALMLCVSMLVGTTFAWFTDSVTSAGNIIKSGSLEVTMEWKDATANGAQKTYKDASEGAIFDYDLWEPGYVEAKNVKIANVGTLALKYQLNILATGTVTKLADVIDVYYAEGEYTLAGREMTELTHIGTLTEVLAKVDISATGDLRATESDTVTIALKMQESAGNEYQNLSIGSEFAVKLMATQLTAETDSFDDQYDKDAWHPEMTAYVGTVQDLLTALEDGKSNIVLASDIASAESIVIPENAKVKLDLNGKTLSATNTVIRATGAGTELTIMDRIGGGQIATEGNNAAALYLKEGAKGVMKSGTLKAKSYGVSIGLGTTADTFVMDGGRIVVDGYAITSSQKAGANITINGGEITAANTTGVMLGKGTLTVNGGTIYSGASNYAAIMTNGQYDDTSITINGGTIDGAGAGIYHPSAGSLKITGGEISGNEMAVSMKSGSLEITGGALNGDAGEALRMENIGDTGYQEIGAVSITGGTFNGKTTAVASVDAGTTAKTGFITGGSFNTDPSQFIADGFKAVDNGDGTWTVKYDGTVVSTAAELSDALATGGNILLTEDVEATASITVPAGVTAKLDLNGKTVTAPAGASWAIQNLGTLTVTGNGTIEGSYTALYSNGNLTVEGGTFTATDGFGVLIDNIYGTEDSVAVINGGTFTGLGVYNPTDITINGGTFNVGRDPDGASDHLSDEMTLFISPTFTGAPNTANVVLNGGTFNGDVYVYDDGITETVFVNNGATITGDVLDNS